MVCGYSRSRPGHFTAPLVISDIARPELYTKCCTPDKAAHSMMLLPRSASLRPLASSSYNLSKLIALPQSYE